MIKKVPVETYAEIRICDKCKIGEMKLSNDNIMLTSYPPKFEHKCSECGITEYFTEKFLVIKHELKEN